MAMAFYYLTLNADYCIYLVYKTVWLILGRFLFCSVAPFKKEFVIKQFKRLGVIMIEIANFKV